jgi:hypothetical protein
MYERGGGAVWCRKSQTTDMTKQLQFQKKLFGKTVRGKNGNNPDTRRSGGGGWRILRKVSIYKTSQVDSEDAIIS